jgi:hypothetical protein
MQPLSLTVTPLRTWEAVDDEETNFHFFSQLPLEMQELIWEQALAEQINGRIHRIKLERTARATCLNSPKTEVSQSFLDRNWGWSLSGLFAGTSASDTRPVIRTEMTLSRVCRLARATVLRHLPDILAFAQPLKIKADLKGYLVGSLRFNARRDIFCLGNCDWEFRRKALRSMDMALVPGLAIPVLNSIRHLALPIKTFKNYVDPYLFHMRERCDCRSSACRVRCERDNIPELVVRAFTGLRYLYILEEDPTVLETSRAGCWCHCPQRKRPVGTPTYCSAMTSRGVTPFQSPLAPAIMENDHAVPASRKPGAVQTGRKSQRRKLHLLYRKGLRGIGPERHIYPVVEGTDYRETHKWYVVRREPGHLREGGEHNERTDALDWCWFPTLRIVRKMRQRYKGYTFPYYPELGHLEIRFLLCATASKKGRSLSGKDTQRHMWHATLKSLPSLDGDDYYPAWGCNGWTSRDFGGVARRKVKECRFERVLTTRWRRWTKRRKWLQSRFISSGS